MVFFLEITNILKTFGSLLFFLKFLKSTGCDFHLCTVLYVK